MIHLSKKSNKLWLAAIILALFSRWQRSFILLGKKYWKSAWLQQGRTSKRIEGCKAYGSIKIQHLYCDNLQIMLNVLLQIKVPMALLLSTLVMMMLSLNWLQAIITFVLYSKVTLRSALEVTILVNLETDQGNIITGLLLQNPLLVMMRVHHLKSLTSMQVVTLHVLLLMGSQFALGRIQIINLELIAGKQKTMMPMCFLFWLQLHCMWRLKLMINNLFLYTLEAIQAMPSFQITQCMPGEVMAMVLLEMDP